MIALAIVTIAALALSRAVRPAEHGVGLDVATWARIRELEGRVTWAEAIEAHGEYLDGKRSYDEVPLPGSMR